MLCFQEGQTKILFKGVQVEDRPVIKRLRRKEAIVVDSYKYQLDTLLQKRWALFFFFLQKFKGGVLAGNFRTLQLHCKFISLADSLQF